MKICSKCKKSLCFDSFSKRSNSRDGFNGVCKECLSSYKKSVRRDVKSRCKALPVEKMCRKCFETKPASMFYKCSSNGDGLYAKCKACSQKQVASRREANPQLFKDSRRRAYLKNETSKAYKERQSKYMWHWRMQRLYGITAEQFNSTLDRQGWSCALCGSEFVNGTNLIPQVDHDHVTGEVRGIICKRCNQGLGCLGDSIEGLERAVAYLKNPPFQTMLKEIGDGNTSQA